MREKVEFIHNGYKYLVCGCVYKSFGLLLNGKEDRLYIGYCNKHIKREKTRHEKKNQKARKERLACKGY